VATSHGRDVFKPGRVGGGTFSPHIQRHLSPRSQQLPSHPSSLSSTLLIRLKWLTSTTPTAQASTPFPTFLERSIPMHPWHRRQPLWGSIRLTTAQTLPPPIGGAWSISRDLWSIHNLAFGLQPATMVSVTSTIVVGRCLTRQLLEPVDSVTPYATLHNGYCQPPYPGHYLPAASQWTQHHHPGILSLDGSIVNTNIH